MLVGLLLCAAPPLTVNAQQSASSQSSPADEQGDLARKLSNPVSGLVSVPFQFNWEQNVGPNEETRFVLNLQPVIPFSITTDWNMIARVILPRNCHPAPAPGTALTACR
jgi:hypothetical protein